MNTTENPMSIFTRAAAAGIDLEAEREMFERQYGPKDNFAWRTPDGNYKVAALQSAWEIWLTSALAHANERDATVKLLRDTVDLQHSKIVELEAALGLQPKAASEQEHNDLARKATYWWDTLLKCARLLDVPVEDSIPQGVLEGVKQLLAQTSNEAGTPRALPRYDMDPTGVPIPDDVHGEWVRFADLNRNAAPAPQPMDSAHVAEKLAYIAGEVQQYGQEMVAAALRLSSEKHEKRAGDILRGIESMLLELATAALGQPLKEVASLAGRARFENWVRAEALKDEDVSDPEEYVVLVLQRCTDGDYATTWVQAGWNAWQAALALLSQDSAAAQVTPKDGEEPAKVEDLAALVRQLVHSLQKAKPGSDLATRAVNYLNRKGLAGNPLR